MDDEELAEELLERYGLERILEDAELNVAKVLIILDELHYLNLEQYEGE